MFGKRNFKTGNHHNPHHHSFGTCICPKCGYSTPHKQGIQCISTICPTCNTRLVRSEIQTTANKPDISEFTNLTNTIQTPATVIYPKVDTELCISCGTCIDRCPADAIILKDDKAFIVNNQCKNCKKCVRICPVEAIS